MHPEQNHAWGIRNVTQIISAARGGLLYKIDYTSGENGFQPQVGEQITLPDGKVYKVLVRDTRYVAKKVSGVFQTTAYLDVFVKEL